jgi:hypothetical protein
MYYSQKRWVGHALTHLNIEWLNYIMAAHRLLECNIVYRVQKVRYINVLEKNARTILVAIYACFHATKSRENRPLGLSNANSGFCRLM